MSGRRKGYLKTPTGELQSGLRLNISLYSAHLAKNRRVHYLDQPPTYPQIFLPSYYHCIPIFCAVAQIFGTKIRNTAESYTATQSFIFSILLAKEEIVI